MANRLQLSKHSAAGREIARVLEVEPDDMGHILIVVDTTNGTMIISSLCCTNHTIDALIETAAESAKHRTGDRS